MKNSFPLLSLVALTSLSLLVSFAMAGETTASGPELLSYSELMRLAPESRAKYVDGVRLILVDLARRSDGKFSDHDPASRSRLKAWLEMLNRDMKTAQADEAPPAPILIRRPSRVVEGPISPQISRRLLSAEAVGTRFSNSVTEFIARSDLDAVQFECASAARTINSEKSRGLPPCTAEKEAAIKAQFVAQKPKLIIETEAPEKAEAPAAPTRRLTLDSPTILAPTVLAQQVALPSKELAPAASNVTNSVTPANTASISLKPQISRRILASEMTTYLERRENPNKLCADEAKKIGAAGAMDLVSIEGTQDRYCMTAEAEALYLAGKLALPDSAPVTDVSRSPSEVPVAATSVASNETKYACAPKPEVCEAPKSARDKIFPGGIPCVFAGMLSVFNSGNRKCQPQTEYSLGDKKYTCASGQTMCNPLLFGTVNETTPICVGRGSNATRKCSELSSSGDALKFLNRSENGLQEKWDEFRKGLSDTCKLNSISAKFHCVECNIIKARIFDLQARLLSDPCHTNRYDDGEHAIDLRIKLGGPKSSGTKK